MATEEFNFTSEERRLNSALRDTRMEKKNSRAYVVIDDLNDIEKIHEGRMEMD